MFYIQNFILLSNFGLKLRHRVDFVFPFHRNNKNIMNNIGFDICLASKMCIIFLALLIAMDVHKCSPPPPCHRVQTFHQDIFCSEFKVMS